METNQIKYNPQIHHRRSIRLKGYDYSQRGAYFVTICCQDKDCLFGNIVNSQLVLNDAGKMVERWYLELLNKYPDIECDAYVVMPNHFHAIIVNTGFPGIVGADLCVCPEKDYPDNNSVCPENIGNGHGFGNEEGEHAGSPLRTVIQWFKTMTTNEYIRGVKTKDWQPFNKKLWQRNYYEHIIRNEQSYRNISDYIVQNPTRWERDKFFV
jgi:REP element-mobilizing transposase RayT